MEKGNVQEFRKELKNILDFWSRHMIDEVHGGFHGEMTGQGQIVASADKGLILNARILWTFSAAKHRCTLQGYDHIIDRAYHYLVNHFLDTKNGGVYWMLDALGNKIQGKKQIYAQAFAIYALAEYHKLKPGSEALSEAIRLFHLIEEHSFDKKQNGYFEAFSEDWKPLADVRLSEKDLNAQKTMNTHLHILEAYANLYSVWPHPVLRSQLTNLIVLMSSTFLFPSGHFKLFFSADWELLTNEVSYAHDIEGSWLLYEAAETIEDESVLSQTRGVSLRLARAALRGLDEDGGLMNHGIDSGQVVDTDKHWWPQAETLVGLVNAYQLTQDGAYLAMAGRNWSFIGEKIIDAKGEWHWRVNREGEPQLEEDKAGPWKCPYHNGRSMMEIIQRLG